MQLYNTCAHEEITITYIVIVAISPMLLYTTMAPAQGIYGMDLSVHGEGSEANSLPAFPQLYKPSAVGYYHSMSYCYQSQYCQIYAVRHSYSFFFLRSLRFLEIPKISRLFVQFLIYYNSPSIHISSESIFTAIVILKLFCKPSHYCSLDLKVLTYFYTSH